MILDTIGEHGPTCTYAHVQCGKLSRDKPYPNPVGDADYARPPRLLRKDKPSSPQNSTEDSLPKSAYLTTCSRQDGFGAAETRQGRIKCTMSTSQHDPGWDKLQPEVQQPGPPM